MKRLFLACTPRTGNLWFRKMLAASLDVPDVAAHSPSDIDWNRLPSGFIAAMHWHATAEMQEFLQERGIEVLVTVRHPLDVLLSILQFCQFEPATAHWLNGEGGTEAGIMGADPTRPQFLEYALSNRAEALLGVSFEWRQKAKAVVRYEDLVEDPHRVIQSVLENLGEVPAIPLEQVVLSYQFSKLKAVIHHHAWLGRPGLWKDVMIEEYRQAIYQRHFKVFDRFGYSIEGAAPRVEEARKKWEDLVSSS
jgi:hypothetical protein